MICCKVHMFQTHEFSLGKIDLVYSNYYREDVYLNIELDDFVILRIQSRK